MLNIYDTKQATLMRRSNSLIITVLDQLLFTLRILFTYVTKLDTSMRRSIVLSLPL